MSQPLVLYGNGGQARVLADCLVGSHRAIVVLDDAPQGECVLPGVELVCGEAVGDWLRGRAGHEFVISIGNEHGAARLEKHAQLEAAGLVPLTAIHQRACVEPSARLGPGCQLLGLAFVGAGARLGRQVIVNTAASVDHDCVVGEGAHIGPGARVAGRVHIGARCFVGTGAIVLPEVRIGADTIVGAGAVVVADLPAGVVAVGNPAKVRRAR